MKCLVSFRARHEDYLSQELRAGLEKDQGPRLRIQNVETTDESICVSLSDGRVVTVPVSWYPRLSHARPEHRAKWELIGQGHGIHWEELDEDISVENILFGQPSGEGPRSFARWEEWYQKKNA
jgi:hypothetical protein